MNFKIVLRLRADCKMSKQKCFGLVPKNSSIDYATETQGGWQCTDKVPLLKMPCLWLPLTSPLQVGYRQQGL